MSTHEVWYVSYGSNLSWARLNCYLAGGHPPGALRAQPGARDPRPPAEDRPVELFGRLYFWGRSTTWAGATAFYDHHTAGPTAARAYRVTVAQLTDIAEQEMHREPGAASALEAALTGGFDGAYRAGPGRYETLVNAGTLDGLPMYTLTSPHRVDSSPHATPSEPYLATMRAGLAESHGWNREAIDRYLGRWLPAGAG
ncbi:histone deacetylase [Myceligenerans indicum]|uniref:Histone deacetylase n=1 Tax=Myceligenerans indicum TaxID=2593663 RepID=A0ABS1LFF0_9MICO|nr:histone deacetylase [Myceligenerans indicum]MBL0884977.1 histone deacetylase [Myceligenerans indicum]